MIEDPHDICMCGDYRRDHPNGGRCIFGSSHGIPKDLPYATCNKFRLSRAAVSVLEPDCPACMGEGLETP